MNPLPLVEVTLRNPENYLDTVTYYIEPLNNASGASWYMALRNDLSLLKDIKIEKNFCWLGCPNKHRNVEFLCTELNKYAAQINQFFGSDYTITDYYSPETVIDPDLYTNHEVLNRLHNHFERLQGTVGNMSEYYELADKPTKFAIRQLNLLCHELETQIQCQRKLKLDPEWLRPAQITSYLNPSKIPLSADHKQDILHNKFDRKFGYVYMHWSHIGKTYYEVYRDENAPKLTNTICEAITTMPAYTGEFDVEWGRDVINDPKCPWHQTEMLNFENWLRDVGIDPNDPELCLGYAPIGRVLLQKSFGTTDYRKIWDILFSHLDIAAIRIEDTVREFKYSVHTDNLYEQFAPTLYGT